MKSRLIYSILLYTAFNGNAWSQHFSQTDKGVRAEVDGIGIEIQFYASDMVRILKWPGEALPETRSFSVVKQPEYTPFTVRQQAHSLQIQSDSLQLELNLETGKIVYADRHGRQLLEETAHGAQFTPADYSGFKSYLIRQAFRLDEEEAIYGLGQQQSGKMNQRNQMVYLRQGNTRICIPYIQSVKGYGLFWDNASPTVFADNRVETSFESQAGEYADYYFVYGSKPDKVLSGMRKLTGEAPMNALWTYGFWQSRERYAGSDELVGTLKKYRELQVPIDCIVQDWQYWGTDNNLWNSTEFGNPRFSDPKKMIDDIHAMHAHVTISVWPSFGRETQINKELKQKGLLLNFNTWPAEAEVYDPFHPEAREIYWNHLNRNMFSLGMDGWWLDATEPEFSDPSAKMDQLTYAGLYRKVYNAFPIVSIAGVHDAQRKVSSDKRVTIMTRSAFAGQQRYGAFSWSGDIQSTWEVLRAQIPAGLNFSVSGNPFWNTDIGGFITYNSYPKGVQDPAYHELYARWIQFGAFTPMMRSHGTNTPREIYQFGQRGDWAFDAIEKYIRLRYRLLPYIYATSWQVSRYGDTFMRPLFMDYSQDKQVADLGTQYMFGRSLLVAPVTTPMYVDDKGNVSLNHVKSQKVYLPEGNAWFDFWTGESLGGGRWVEKVTPVDVMPLYVRAGSILPFGPDVQYATEKKWDDLEIRIYRGADGEFLLYEDENDGYNYEKGMYATIRFRWDDKSNTLIIGPREGEFPGMLTKRKFRIVLVDKQHGAGDQPAEKADKTVSYSGKQLKIKL